MPTAAGIVLAGGRSTRMGTPKAALEWHGSTLLRHVVGLVARGVEGPVVVVRAAGQALPSLPVGVEVVQDAREGRGPLQGLAAGLAAVGGRAEMAYASSTDAPLLHPAFVLRVLRALDDDVDVVLPHARGFPQPLAAAYRTALLKRIERRLADDRVRLAGLFEECRLRRLDESQLLADPDLAAADPQLDSLLNLNEPADYDAARSLPAPEVLVEGFGTVRAATLGTAARGAGIALDGVATLNGAQVSRDRELPLVAGDVIVFAGD
ncbi:MAG: molybdenum cofactor guanylyltransferase [Solirubrobacteraceae bacterium]